MKTACSESELKWIKKPGNKIMTMMVMVMVMMMVADSDADKSNTFVMQQSDNKMFYFIILK